MSPSGELITFEPSRWSAARASGAAIVAASVHAAASQVLRIFFFSSSYRVRSGPMFYNAPLS
jgi:hypothetical protein